MGKNNNISTGILVATFIIGFIGLVSLIGPAIAATSIHLGAAENFAILAGSTITNTGSSQINGDVGLSPGTSVTGFPPGIINGTQHVNDTEATNAKSDLITAYNNAAGQASVTVPAELGGATKTPGVYNSVSGLFSITGTLTLDAQNDPNAIFIFKTDSTLITEGASSVVLVNGAQAGNVFWQVGSSATLGTNSTFKGNILALTSITLTTGVNMEGRVLALNGAVTLDTDTVIRATSIIATPSPTPSATPTPTPSATPTPSVTPSPTLSATPTPSATPSPTPSATPLPSPTPVIAPIVSPTPTSTSTPPPGFPDTGIGPDQKSIPWNIVIPASIFISSIFFYFVRRKEIV